MFGAEPRQRKHHNAAGGKDSTHGLNYQLAVMMRTFLIGLRTREDFILGGEVKEAGKFDDLVYGYMDKGKRIYRLAQLKHKSDNERSRITLNALLSKNPKSDFGFVTYLNSFREVKGNFIGDEEIGDLIMFTNGMMKWGDKVVLNKGSDEEVTFAMKDAFKKKLDDEGKTVNDELFQTELYQFTEDAEERRKWAKYLAGNASIKDSALKEDVKTFMDKLLLAVEQPEEESLKKTILDELKTYVNYDLHEAYSRFYTQTHRWLTGKDCFFLDREDGLQMLEELKSKYGRVEFGVDRPVINFSGRAKELWDLKQAFECGKRRVVVCGLGGVGKTQLAKRFLEMYPQTCMSVMWMKAESYDDLLFSFKRLAFNNLGIKEERDDGKPKDIESILEEVKRQLENRSSIFVFDNARYMVDRTTNRSDLDVFLKKLPNNAALLMTSRCRDWDNFFVYPLEPLSDQDAAQLIKNSLVDHVELEDEQVMDLAAEMQNYPLAIQQAIANIKKRSVLGKQFNMPFGIDSYLELFRKNHKTLLEHNLQRHNEDAYFYTTMTTWDITLAEIKNGKNGTLCEKILRTISYFFADDIPVSDIEHCFGDETKDDIIACLRLLDELSMVNILNGRCTVHRLVQKVTRSRLQETEEEKSLLDSVLMVGVKLDVRNVVSVWEHCAEHEDLVRKHSDMPCDVIWYLIETSSYADGYVYGKRLTKIMETIIDPTDMKMFRVNSALAEVARQHGMYDESYELYKKVYELSCRFAGKDKKITLRLKNYLGDVLMDLRKYGESYEILKEVSESMDRIFGREDEDSIRARHSLALGLKSLGRYVESYVMIKEICYTSERVFGREHLHAIDARNTLASVLLYMGRYGEAMDIFDEVWECKRRNLGEEHPHTVCMRINIAAALYKLGDYAESLEILEKVCECLRRTLGEEHPHTLRSKRLIVEAIQHLGPCVNFT